MRRALVAAAAAGLVAFALFGGEYGILDVRALRRDIEAERRRMDSLRADVDSLSRERRLILTDSATQEKAAREQFGMIRDGELLYQVVPDSR